MIKRDVIISRLHDYFVSAYDEIRKNLSKHESEYVAWDDLSSSDVGLRVIRCWERQKDKSKKFIVNLPAKSAEEEAWNVAVERLYEYIISNKKDIDQDILQWVTLNVKPSFRSRTRPSYYVRARKKYEYFVLKTFNPKFLLDLSKIVNSIYRESVLFKQNSVAECKITEKLFGECGKATFSRGKEESAWHLKLHLYEFGLNLNLKHPYYVITGRYRSPECFKAFFHRGIKENEWCISISVEWSDSIFSTFVECIEKEVKWYPWRKDIHYNDIHLPVIGKCVRQGDLILQATTNIQENEMPVSDKNELIWKESYMKVPANVSHVDFHKSNCLDVRIHKPNSVINADFWYITARPISGHIVWKPSK